MLYLNDRARENAASFYKNCAFLMVNCWLTQQLTIKNAQQLKIYFFAVSDTVRSNSS
jgi:hypothetical protein